MNAITDHFLIALEKVLGKPNPLIALHEPEFSGSAWENVRDCLDSTFVSSVGKYVNQFENQLEEYTGAKHAIAVVNGTTALQVALVLAGVNPGDEVLIPALSFVATANAVAHCGGIPHFIDSCQTTLGIDTNILENHLQDIAQIQGQEVFNKHTQRRISAIVPMHTYGHPVNLVKLLEIANRYNLPVVEDAAEALGSTYQGQHLGTFGRLGIISFNGNKIITTGGGGAILTNDSDLAALAKHLTTTAKVKHPWNFFHDYTAWNYRLPNLNAALGCAQMEQLPDLLQQKRKLAQRYQDVFQNIQGVSYITEPAKSQSNYWLNTVRLVQPSYVARNHLLEAANNAGYQCRPTWTLLHKLPMYANCPHSTLAMSEQLEASLISIPSSAKLAGGIVS
jgi:perosamine synthetase